MTQILLNIIYSTFFLVVDFVLYALLNKAYRIEKAYLRLLGSLVVILILLHNDFYNNRLLMPQKEFVDILMFSFSIVILHFGSKFQVSVVKSSNVYSNPSNRKISEFALKVYDVMRFKIIYILIYAYQFLAVWMPEIS